MSASVADALGRQPGQPANRSATLFAPRLRVEERELTAALADRGYEATIVNPMTWSIALTGVLDGVPELALFRNVTTPEYATLAALLAANGATVVNRAATARLLADRLALLRHLIVAGIQVPESVVAFGEEATRDALQRIGYPAWTLSPVVDPGVPDAWLPDADAGESVVELRTTLGHERMTLIQEHVEGRSLRLAVAGLEVIGAEAIEHSRSGAVVYAAIDGLSADLAAIGERVIARLGSGVYQVKVVEGVQGPVVVGAASLVDFRSLSEAGVDVAGKIADFALSQLPGASAA